VKKKKCRKKKKKTVWGLTGKKKMCSKTKKRGWLHENRKRGKKGKERIRDKRLVDQIKKGEGGKKRGEKGGGLPETGKEKKITREQAGVNGNKKAGLRN